MRETDLYQIMKAQVFDKTSMVLIHDQKCGGVFIDYVSRTEFNLDLEGNQIVSVLDASFFLPYFGFMDEELRETAQTTITVLVHKIANIAVFERCAKGFLPAAFKSAYYWALKRLRRLQGGCFMTQIFIRKLRNLLMTIWRHGQIYQRFQPAQHLIPSLDIEYVC